MFTHNCVAGLRIEAQLDVEKTYRSDSMLKYFGEVEGVPVLDNPRLLTCSDWEQMLG
jgi:hypothetical protein